jgi:hypothetical protein
VPNQAESWIEQYDKSLKASIESALIAENKSSTIEQFATHWKKVVSFEQSIKFKMNSYRSSFREALSNLYFEQFKRSNSVSSQDSLVASFLTNFESYEPWADGKDDSEDFIKHVMSTAKNKNGAVNIYNSVYLVDYLTATVPEFSSEFNYKGSSYSLRKRSNKSSMIWSFNELSSKAVTYNDNSKESEIVFAKFPFCDSVYYFQNTALAVVSCYKEGKLLYSYEFENGENISIKALSNDIKQAKRLFSENKLDEAGEYFARAKNNFPESLPENIELAESLAKYNAEVDKRNAEKKAADEKAATAQMAINNANAMREKYGKKIKDEMVAVFTIASVYSEELGEKSYQELIDKIQNEWIHREFTNEDIIVFNSLFEEAKAVFKGYVNIMNQSAESDRQEKKCTWCGRVFTGPSWYPDKDVSDNCGSRESSYNGFGSGYERCCSSKCAIEKCYHE